MKGPVVIRLLELVGNITEGEAMGLPAYLKSYDPWAFAGWGNATITHDLTEALLFDSYIEAHQLWATVTGTRTDGKPNRPLTAFTIEIIPVEVSHGNRS